MRRGVSSLGAAEGRPPPGVVAQRRSASGDSAQAVKPGLTGHPGAVLGALRKSASVSCMLIPSGCSALLGPFQLELLAWRRLVVKVAVSEMAEPTALVNTASYSFPSALAFTLKVYESDVAPETLEKVPPPSVDTSH